MLHKNHQLHLIEASGTLPAIETLNPNAEVFAPSNSKQPALSGKHRKSKVNEVSPEVEFLKATVDTLKATIVKNELENKKLKESNDIKAKRILNLEAQIQEAKTTITKHQCPSFEGPPDTETKSCNNDVYQKVQMSNIESRTNAMEHNIALLTSKFDNLQFNILNMNKTSGILSSESPKITKVFSCESCDHETFDRNESKKHKKEHKSITVFNCNSCDYETQENNDYKKHQEVHNIQQNFRCKKCSYIAIHTRDLNRHDRVMHEEETIQISACEKCPYSTQYSERLEEHMKQEHSYQTRSRFFYATSRKVHNAINNNAHL